MAQQPNFQPILDQSSFSPDPGRMVNRLKGSASMVEALGDLGKLAVGTTLQYGKQKAAEQEANVRAQVGAALDPLIQEGLLGSPSYRKEQTDELATYQETLNRLPLSEAPEDVNVLNQGITRIQGEVDKRLQFLTRAKDQGRMDAFTFEQNVKAITRKFISDNPGLRSEILETTKATLEDQGIIERLKFDEQAAKDAASIYENDVKFIRQELKDLDIPEIPFRNPDGSLDLNRARQAADRMRAAKGARNAFIQDMDFNKRVTEEEIRTVEQSGVIPLVMEGEYADITAGLSDIFTQNADNFPKAKLQAKSYLANRLVAIRSNPNIAKYQGSQVVKDNIANLEKQIQALDTAMESFASNEDLQKFTQNQKNILQDQQSLRLMKDFDVPRIELMMKIGQVANLINSTQGQNYMKDLIVNSRDLFTLGKLTDPNIFKSVPGTNQSGASVLLNQSLKGNNASVTNQIISGTVDAINDPKVSTNQVEAFTRADTFLKDIGNPEYMEKFIDAEPETFSKTIDLLTKYNEQIDIDLQKYFVTNPNKNVKLEVNPGTGMVYAQGADTDFNTRYVSRINNALKAYANMRVQSPKEVWKDFYQEFFPSISQGRTLSTQAANTNNPLNFKDDKGQVRTFNSLEEAVVTYENELFGGSKAVNEKTSKVAAQEFERNKKLFEQKKITLQEYRDRASSLNAALKGSIQEESAKPKTIKSIVDNFYESAKTGGMQESREEAYRFLGDYLTKSPTTPLDLNDKETVAKLIAGMAKLESNTDLEWLRVSSFLKKAGSKKSVSKAAIDSATKPDNFMNPGANK